MYSYKRNNNKLPDTLTQLYETFLLHTIKHFADRISSDPNFLKEVDDVHCYDALPVSVQYQLNLLSKMAFVGMKEDKLVFTPNELQQLDLLCLGLLTSLFVLTNITEIKHFQFLHLTIQEFLAAKYLSSGCMSMEEVTKFFRNNINADRFRMTLLFLAGLTKLNFLAPNETLLKECDQTLIEFEHSPPKLLFYCSCCMNVEMNQLEFYPFSSQSWICLSTPSRSLICMFFYIPFHIPHQITFGRNVA